MSIINTKQLLQNIADRLTAEASARKVYGEPIVSGEKTIIPVARVLLGFGGGFGEGRSTLKGAPGVESKKAGADGQGEGGGLGGGLIVQPLGVIEVTPQRTHYLPISVGRYVAVGLALGLVIGGLAGRRRR